MQECPRNADFMLLILPAQGCKKDDLNLYKLTKRLAISELGLPTHYILHKTLTSGKGVTSILSKLLMQIFGESVEFGGVLLVEDGRELAFDDVVALCEDAGGLGLVERVEGLAAREDASGDLGGELLLESLLVCLGVLLAVACVESRGEADQYLDIAKPNVDSANHGK
jgi:hypothetical protein